jgi:hypothetical protein
MEAVKPGTRWTVTVPGGAWVSYTHQVDPAEPWRAAGAVTGDPELVAAVEATMDGSLEHVDHVGGSTMLTGWTQPHATGWWLSTTSVMWHPGDDETPADLALCLVAVTPVGSTVCPALDRYLVALLDAQDREALTAAHDDGSGYA